MLQLSLFPVREARSSGFPNPLLVPARARNYVKLEATYFRRSPLSIGKPEEMWWAVQPHSILFEIGEVEKSRIPAFARSADMEAYLERLGEMESQTRN